MTMRKCQQQGQRGGALVEFAIVAPVALVFLFAIIQFGQLMFAYHATDYAARAATRYASVRGALCTNSASDGGGNANCPASSASLQYYVQNSVPGASSAQVTAAWASPDPASYPSSSTGLTCSSSSEEAGCQVKVTVQNSYTLVIPFIPNLGKINMSSTAAAIVQN